MRAKGEPTAPVRGGYSNGGRHDTKSRRPEARSPEPERYCVVVAPSDGTPNATYSPEYGPPLIATTMYCLPSMR
jgi:hypothetical protein